MDQDRQSARENFRQLSGKEKFQHIVRYYGLAALGIVIVIIILIDLIGRHTFAKEKDACLGIAVHARYLDLDQIDLMPDHFAKLYPEPTEDGAKEYKVYSFYNGYTAAEMEEKTAMIYRMAAFIQTEMLDVIIGDEESLSFDGSSGYLVDLRDVFTEEELMAISEKANLLSRDQESGILSMDISETGDTGRIKDVRKDIPLLICIRNTDSIIDESLAKRPVYIGIVSNAPNLDNAKYLILQLLHMEP
ncbi:MAG: hypothetical protein IKG51_04120 [Firmicutes bacterium]|nr:hypothetical protein [Bacillota bacterium]